MSAAKFCPTIVVSAKSAGIDSPSKSLCRAVSVRMPQRGRESKLYSHKACKSGPAHSLAACRQPPLQHSCDARSAPYRVDDSRRARVLRRLSRRLVGQPRPRLAQAHTLGLDDRLWTLSGACRLCVSLLSSLESYCRLARHSRANGTAHWRRLWEWHLLQLLVSRFVGVGRRLAMDRSLVCPGSGRQSKQIRRTRCNLCAIPRHSVCDTALAAF